MQTYKKYDDRLLEILDVSENLFITKGYAKTTVNDILAGVGISKGAFYYYFNSKEEVMDAVITRVVEGYRAQAQAIAHRPDLTAGEKFYQILTAPNTQGNHTAEIVSELHNNDNSAMHQKSLVQTILAISPILEEVVRQGIQEGVYMTPYPGESVEFLFTAAQFLLDPGLFRWSAQEVLQKLRAFAYILELTLGSAKGSFDWLVTTNEAVLGEMLEGAQEKETI